MSNCIYGHLDHPGLEVVVCLRKSPVRTPALLAANRSNSLKSTGPRTEAGKARVSLNGLKHGRYARHLPQRLHAAGLRDGLLLWLQTHRAISHTFQPQVWQEEAQAQRLANEVFALAWRARVFGAKPECGLFSSRLGLRTSSLFPIRIEDRRQRVALAFWIQRKAYWTPARLLQQVFAGAEGGQGDSGFGSGRSQTSATETSGFSRNPNPNPESRTPGIQEPPLRLAMEGRVRCRAYRMRRPSLWERAKYGSEAPPTAEGVGAGDFGSGPSTPTPNPESQTPEPAPSELDKLRAILRAARARCSSHEIPAENDDDG